MHYNIHRIDNSHIYVYVGDILILNSEVTNHNLKGKYKIECRAYLVKSRYKTVSYLNKYIILEKLLNYNDSIVLKMILLLL
jgi:hypothetical protein